MKETELLGKLMPGHPDIKPIIENIREKYLIPEVSPEDDIGEILMTRDDIDWEAVRKDIETQVHNIQLFDDKTSTNFQNLRKIQSTPFDFPELEGCPKEVQEQIKKLLTALMQHFAPMLALVDDIINKPITEMIFEYLLTGKTREVPQEWIGKVYTMNNMLGEKVVVAMAGGAADPKVIAEQFKIEFTKTFGKHEHKITETHLSTAEYLTMKLQGNSLKRLVERYQEKHSSEFPIDRTSREYRKAIVNQKDMMKKRLKRLIDVLEKIAGDKN